MEQHDQSNRWLYAAIASHDEFTAAGAHKAFGHLAWNQQIWKRSGPPCEPQPDAPHGFDLTASLNAGRYVCECEAWNHAKTEGHE